MTFKFSVSGGDKTLDKVYNEMINSYQNKDIYNGIYNRFIKDILGNIKIKDLTSNDIDYFYMYLINKNYHGHLYSKNYIHKIMNLLCKILDYGIKCKYIETNLVKIKIYFTKNDWLMLKLPLYLYLGWFYE